MQHRMGHELAAWRGLSQPAQPLAALFLQVLEVWMFGRSTSGVRQGSAGHDRPFFQLEPRGPRIRTGSQG